MAININSHKFQALIDQMVNDPLNQMFIVQNDGEFVTKPSTSLFTDKDGKFAYFDRIEQNAELSGSFIKNITLISTSVLLVASLIISVILSWVIYSPIRSLIQLVKRQTNGLTGLEMEGDIEIVKRAFSKVVVENESLENFSHRTQVLLKEQFLKSRKGASKTTMQVGLEALAHYCSAEGTSTGVTSYPSPCLRTIKVTGS